MTVPNGTNASSIPAPNNAPRPHPNPNQLGRAREPPQTNTQPNNAAQHSINQNTYFDD
jgi:hypothetical protein